LPPLLVLDWVVELEFFEELCWPDLELVLLEEPPALEPAPAALVEVDVEVPEVPLVPRR